MPVRLAGCAGSELRLRMTGVVDFDALRQEPFAAALATPRESGAPAFRAHPRAKTVLILSGALRALKCSFHNVGSWGGATLRFASPLSIPTPALDRDPLAQSVQSGKIMSKIKIRSRN